MSETTNSLRYSVYGLLEGHKSGVDASRFIRRFIVALIVVNGFAVILESNDALYRSYSEIFHAIEIFSVIVFSIEYGCRVWISTESMKYAHLKPWRARVAFMLTPMALIDLLAVAPFYLSLFIPIDLRYLRFFRLLRLLKLSHYFDGLQVFSTVLRREASAIAGALLIMLILIIVSACLMFTVENSAQPGHFSSITEAIWWAVVTLTTVGYGDITPITFGGKLLGIVIMMLGVGTMALPAGILAARFSEELQSRRELIRRRVADALRDGVLDPRERSSIKKLQRELGLSRDIVDRLINQQRRDSLTNRYCPHCGESLEKNQ